MQKFLLVLKALSIILLCYLNKNISEAACMDSGEEGDTERGRKKPLKSTRSTALSDEEKEVTKAFHSSKTVSFGLGSTIRPHLTKPINIVSNPTTYYPSSTTAFSAVNYTDSLGVHLEPTESPNGSSISDIFPRGCKFS
jgi:hypothetical protein